MPAIACHCWLLLLILLLCLPNCMIRDVEAIRSPWSSRPPTTHSNFLLAAVQGRQQRRLWCGSDPSACLDPEKNPWGGTTCCSQRFCKDTMTDRDNCGGCGYKCAYRLICCGGQCVDVQSDADHCGSCHAVCTGETGCNFGMCDYAGGDL